eukprot:gene5836-7263_t
MCKRYQNNQQHKSESNNVKQQQQQKEKENNSNNESIVNNNQSAPQPSSETTTTSTTTNGNEHKENHNSNNNHTNNIKLVKENSSNSSNNDDDDDEKYKKNESDIFSIDFSSWSRSKDELVDLSYGIFKETGLVSELQVDREIVLSYLTKVKESYRDNPFHSFNHAVTEKLSLIIASVCHDLDHPGLSNRFQINSKSQLAILYNNKSVLENHHLSICLQLLNAQTGKDLLQNLSDSDREQLFEKVKILILATDMENHFQYKNKFDEIIPVFSWDNQEHRDLLLIMLLKSADISNELRSWDISHQWARALMEEFFKQSDLEKINNLPLTPFMQREQVVLNSTQVSFIDKFLLPSYQALQTLLPSFNVFVERINKNRETWSQYST